MLGNVKIEKLCRSINLIEPYMPENQQPCSYDLTLGDGFLEPADQLIDMVHGVKYNPVQGPAILQAGGFVLGTTVEKINLPLWLQAQVDGRSSLGRCGLMVHATAGFIDCGFRGNITLEIKNITQNCAIRLVPGRRIAQISFERVEGCDMRYAGKYQGQDAVTGSRINQDSEVQK